MVDDPHLAATSVGTSSDEHCRSAGVVDTHPTTAGRRRNFGRGVRCCRGCAAFRFPMHLPGRWVPAEPPEGFAYPDNAGMEIPR